MHKASAQISDERALDEIKDEVTTMKHDLMDVISKLKSNSKDDTNKMKADSMMEKTSEVEPESMDEITKWKRETMDETKTWNDEVDDEVEHIEDMNERRNIDKNGTKFRGCMFEKTHYLGPSGVYVPYALHFMNKYYGYNFDTCKSMCRGHRSYTKNPHYYGGGTCNYVMRYLSRGREDCFLYATLAQARARSSGNNPLATIYKMICKDNLVDMSACICDGDNPKRKTPNCQDYQSEGFDWCYLKKHKDDELCPGAVDSSSGDYYWTKDVTVCNANKKQQDGGLSTWSSWTQCTVLCNGGTRQRTRSCTNPAPEGDGKDCSSLGDTLETESCNDKLCPVDGGLSTWSSWTQCTVLCNGGTRQRTRSCTNPAPEGDGKDCTGDRVETESCNNDPCKVCEFERTNYDGMTAFDNPLNSVTRGVTKATCESWCKGDTTYTRNAHGKLPQNSKCIYMKWRTGGVCSLYSRFRDVRAWHRGSPGNLYQLKCKVVAA